MRDHTSSFRYTLSVLAKLDGSARREIQRLGGNPALELILDKMRVQEGQDSPSLVQQ